jgi:hypothetical protein
MRRDAITIFILVLIVLVSPSFGKPASSVSKKKSSADARLSDDARDKREAAEAAALNAITAAMAKREQERTAERQQETAVESKNIHLQQQLIRVGLAQTVALIVTFFAVWYQAKKTAAAAKAAADSVEAINRQAVIMERQTAATETTANAANLNAEALINSERPWILVENFQLFELVPMENQIPVRFAFDIQNYGRTPARITKYRARLHINESTEMPPDPNVYALFDSDIPQRIVPVNREPALRDSVLLQPRYYLSQAEIEQITNGVRFLWAYGFVRYEDVLVRREYETRFCYRYVLPPYVPTPIFALAGPREYNDAT